MFIFKEDTSNFWEVFDNIRKGGKYMGSRWQGNYYVTTYNYNGKNYEVWDNMDDGIIYGIKEA